MGLCVEMNEVWVTVILQKICPVRQCTIKNEAFLLNPFYFRWSTKKLTGSPYINTFVDSSSSIFCRLLHAFFHNNMHRCLSNENHLMGKSIPWQMPFLPASNKGISVIIWQFYKGAENRIKALSLFDHPVFTPFYNSALECR